MLDSVYYVVRTEGWPEYKAGVVTTLPPHGLFFVGQDAKENAYAYAKNCAGEFGRTYAVGLLKATAIIKPMTSGMKLS